MFNYIIYGAYNLIYQIISVFLLLYVNTYINTLLLPDSLRWKNGQLREDLSGLMIANTILLIVETALLVILLYYLNKQYINAFKGSDHYKIAWWTTGVYAAVTLMIVVFSTYLNYR